MRAGSRERFFERRPSTRAHLPEIGRIALSSNQTKAASACLRGDSREIRYQKVANSSTTYRKFSAPISERRRYSVPRKVPCQQISKSKPREPTEPAPAAPSPNRANEIHPATASATDSSPELSSSKKNPRRPSRSCLPATW